MQGVRQQQGRDGAEEGGESDTQAGEGQLQEHDPFEADAAAGEHEHRHGLDRGGHDHAEAQSLQSVLRSVPGGQADHGAKAGLDDRGGDDGIDRAHDGITDLDPTAEQDGQHQDAGIGNDPEQGGADQGQDDVLHEELQQDHSGDDEGCDHIGASVEDAAQPLLLVLRAAHAAEQDAVGELAEHGDGRVHEVDAAFIEAHRGILGRRQELVEHEQVKLGGGVVEEIEDGARRTIPQQTPGLTDVGPQGDAQAGPPPVIQAEQGVLDEQGADVGVDPPALCRGPDTEEGGAESHGEQGGPEQAPEIHPPDEQGARDEGHRGNEEAEGDPAHDRFHVRLLEPAGDGRCREVDQGAEGGPLEQGKPEGGRDLLPAEVLSLDEGRADPELGEDFEQAREAEDHTDEAPFGLGEELPENTDKGELDEDLDPDIQGLPLDGARKGAVLALAHLATLTARVSRMTVTLTWPG